ncbi:MAG TPA: Crp/Fnr family transcriptional regulator [Thermoanaerobaculia bacterium]|jgi:CRP-like cAMP-binding protein|nr:Crp/Fnr family transcriptional regulator [Thermoanaerobaculia bacterium]
MPTNDGRAQTLVPSLREVFDRASVADARVRVNAQESIYASGDEDESMYLIESGQVKLSMASAAGKDCLIAIYTKGEVFGESCFTAAPKRFETATAMQPTIVRRVSRRDFLAEVERLKATEALLRHLATRIADRQSAVFDLVTMPSQQRLAKVLLDMSEKLGVRDGAYLRLDPKVSHEELSQIVGTTRPRITAFMQRFRALGLIETAGRAIMVHHARMLEFVGHD